MRVVVEGLMERLRNGRRNLHMEVEMWTVCGPDTATEGAGVPVITSAELFQARPVQSHGGD